MANMCAGVTSTYMEFTLTFWNLKMHFSFYFFMPRDVNDKLKNNIKGGMLYVT